MSRRLTNEDDTDVGARRLVHCYQVVLIPIALAETYEYDAQGRLSKVTTDAGVVTYYCYDAAGNRTYVGPTAC